VGGNTVSVTIARILDAKGHEVTTTTREARLADVVRAMAERNVGALVVVDGDDAVLGIVSERDVVRRLGAIGHDALELTIGEVMTAPVHTCPPEATTDDLVALMTERRFRHVPVVVDERLAGIVSIGDVVKWRLEELRTTAEQLTEYVSGSY
jgi:CBS domain-containing protein